MQQANERLAFQGLHQSLACILLCSFLVIFWHILEEIFHSKIAASKNEYTFAILVSSN
jgi:hypothetical protein